MPTETEEYMDEEMMRDAERGVDAEHTSEFANDEGLDDESEVDKETDDPALQDILLHKGGRLEDWELTYRGTAEYFFNGSEVINAKTGTSWTKEIEGGSDEANVAVHHAMLEQWKNGESLTRLPDFEEEKENGDVVLHVTHMIRGADNSVNYEIRSTVISRREEEETFSVAEKIERMGSYARVEFQEGTETTMEEHAEPAPETVEYAHETTIDNSTPIEITSETRIAQEVAPTVQTEQWIETVPKNPTEETANETEKKNVSDAWLYDVLKDNIYIPTQKQHEAQESTSVVVGKIDTEVIVGRPAVVHPEIVSVEQPVKQPEPFVAKKIEIPSFEEPLTRLVRTVVMPSMEQRPIALKVETQVEKREVKIAVEPTTDVEKVQPIILKVPETQKQVIRPQTEVRAQKKTTETAPRIVREKLKNNETVDKPATMDSKIERVLSGQEILLRTLGLSNPPAGRPREQTHAFAHTEGLRPTRSASWRTPPQQDEQSAPRPRSVARTLNGISMRKAA